MYDGQSKLFMYYTYVHVCMYVCMYECTRLDPPSLLLTLVIRLGGSLGFHRPLSPLLRSRGGVLSDDIIVVVAVAVVAVVTASAAAAAAAVCGRCWLLDPTWQGITVVVW